MFLNILNTKLGAEKAIWNSAAPCTLCILSFKPNYEFSSFWHHPQPWLDSQTLLHPHYEEFSKFDIKPVKSTIFEYQTVLLTICPLYSILNEKLSFRVKTVFVEIWGGVSDHMCPNCIYRLFPVLNLTQQAKYRWRVYI